MSYYTLKQNEEKLRILFLLSLLNIKPSLVILSPIVNFVVVVVRYIPSVLQIVFPQSWSCVTLQLSCSKRERKKIIKSLRVRAM